LIGEEKKPVSWGLRMTMLAEEHPGKVAPYLLPMRGEMPAIERDAMLDLLNPTVVVSRWENVSYPNFTPEVILAESANLDDSLLPDVVAHPGKAIGSGGSTGRSKITVFPGRWELAPGQRKMVGT